MLKTTMCLALALLWAPAATAAQIETQHDETIAGAADTPLEHDCACLRDQACEETETMKTSDTLLEQLDPGIREVVRFLRMRGHETTDSGDGKTKVAQARRTQLIDHRVDVSQIRNEPHVVIRVDNPRLLVDACERVREDLESQGVRVVALGPSRGEAVIEGRCAADGIAIVEVTHLDDFGLKWAQQQARGHAQRGQGGGILPAGAPHVPDGHHVVRTIIPSPEPIVTT